MAIKEEVSVGIRPKDLTRENMKLFVYAKPNTMDGYLQNGDCHRFTDDVALCYANSVEEAVEIFSKLYDRTLIEGNVNEAWFNSYDICICTDF